MKSAHLVFLAALLLSSPLCAQEPAAKLKATQSQLKQSQQRAAALERNRTKLENELSALQEKLIVLAEAARAREQRLLDLEEEQSQLNGEVKTAQEDLRLHHKEVSVLVGSLIRLSRIPPEAVIAMPGELRHTMQAASLLQSTTRQLQEKAGELNRKLATLERTQKALEGIRVTLADETRKMQSAQESLAAEVAERKTISGQLNRQHAREQDKIATLTRQSHNLRQLLDKLERKRAVKTIPIPVPPVVPPKRWEPAQQYTPAPPRTITGQRYASFNAARGKLSLPVAGRVLERYGQKLHQNQTSRGFSIASRAGNAVLAPYAGEVVFTGPFLDYGRMVILRYDSGYHLLLAGLDDINCVTGQQVTAGEPLGRLGNNGSRPGTLYLELRYRSKPINPAPWFG